MDYEILKESLDPVLKGQNEFKKKIEYMYEEKVALAETEMIKSRGQNATGKWLSPKDRMFLYSNDIILQKNHEKFVKWMSSTKARFLVSRLIVADYYAKKVCTLTSLQKDTEFTRNAIADIIKTSEDAEWIIKKNNKNNKKEMLIIPTVERLKYWSIYCKVRFLYHEEIGIAKAHRLLSAYYSLMD